MGDKKSKKDKKRKKSKKGDKQAKQDRKDEKLRARAEEKRLKKEQKTALQATETLAEKNARRLAKKAAKAEKKKKQSEIFGYTNEDNPFNDARLTEVFLWGKKHDKEKAEGTLQRNVTKQQLRRKQMEKREEIEKVKRRRIERDVENEQMEEMKAQMERDMMMMEAEGWEQKEEEFHQKQAKLRSEIRIKEGREKAIDILAKNLHLYRDEEAPDADLSVDLDIELTEPDRIFDGLNGRDLEELHRDIQIHVDLKQESEYWNALSSICGSELKKAKRREATEGKFNSGHAAQTAVQDDVDELLKEKDMAELEALELQINSKLERGDPGTDFAYWENLLENLQIHKSKAFLREFHSKLLKKRLKQLREQHFREELERGSDDDQGSDDDNDDFEPSLLPHQDEGQDDKKVKALQHVPAGAFDSDDEDDFEPELIADDDEEAVDPEQDQRELEAQRRVVLEQKEMEEQEVEQDSREMEAERKKHKDEVMPAHSRFMITADELYEKEKRAGLAADEVQLKEEVDIPTPKKAYWWHDKYRPRKPRYFNRVKTGYEWNKYNQTHYDKENPPPKIVQGYKFNVFYPDLIDPSKPPSYRLEPIEGEKDYAMIVFMAGPPYEDVGFKIVRKEWEYSHKRGFKCVFTKGCLHLYFNFRRFFYRR